jgi:hypothetical protein
MKNSRATAFHAPLQVLHLQRACPEIRQMTLLSPRSTHGEKDGYESPVSEDGDIGQEANRSCDLAAFAERKNADANADSPDRSEEPCVPEKRIPKELEIARVRKGSASRANESSDSGCQRDAACCGCPLSSGEPSAEQHHNDEGRNQNQDDDPTDHNDREFIRSVVAALNT